MSAKNQRHVHLYIIGADAFLNNITIDHLKIQIQQNGNTVSVMPDPSEGIDVLELIKGDDVKKSIQLFTQIWDETRKQLEEKQSADFVIFRQSLESLQSYSSMLGVKARNDEDAFRMMKRLYRRENEALETERQKENCLPIKLYLFDSNPEEGETIPEEATLNAVLSYACRTQSHNRVFHYFNLSPSGHIWSRICGLIQAEPEFAKLLYDWQFNQKICDLSRKDANDKKRKHFLEHSNAICKYIATHAAKTPY